MRDGWARLAKTDGDSIALCIWPKPRARVCSRVSFAQMKLKCAISWLFISLPFHVYKYHTSTVVQDDEAHLV